MLLVWRWSQIILTIIENFIGVGVNSQNFDEIILQKWSKNLIYWFISPHATAILKNKDPINHNLCAASNDLLKNFININIVLKLKFFHCILLNIVFKPHWTLWMHWVGKFFRRENNFQFNPLMYKEKLHSL